MGWIITRRDRYLNRDLYLRSDRATKVKTRWVYNPEDALVYSDRHQANLSAQMYGGNVVEKEEQCQKNR